MRTSALLVVPARGTLLLGAQKPWDQTYPLRPVLRKEYEEKKKKKTTQDRQ